MPKLTTIKAAAEYLLVNELTVRRWIAEGKLNAYRVGRSIRLDDADVRSLLKPMEASELAYLDANR